MRDLTSAKVEKNDEFYTQLSDIENELRHYKKHFKDKVVFCNCDDPFESNFFKYFAMNFNKLGLKKLITTCYAGSPIVTSQLSLFDVKGLTIKEGYEKHPYKIEITEVNDINADGAIDITDVEYLIKNKNNTLTLLKGDGDFRSGECIELLKESDIVVTNPPFSLFREYVAQLIEYKKNFLILSNMNAITYKEFFPYLKNNQIWTGYGFNLSMVYKTPYPNLLESNRKYVLSKGYNPDEGFVKVPGICWFTNLDIEKRHEDIILFKKYNPVDYPKYDNYNAIEVNKVSEIPVDYYSLMGVPITFLDKYNPKQFKLIGTISAASEPGTLNLGKDYSKFIGYKQNREKNGRTGSTFGKCPVIVMDDKIHPYYEKDGIRVQATYHRIFIQRIDGDEIDE